jgi:hypothetical protein
MTAIRSAKWYSRNMRPDRSRVRDLTPHFYFGSGWTSQYLYKQFLSLTNAKTW